jgi:hypothetical protein
MKQRTPRFAFILALIISAIIFTYLNYCPSVGQQIMNNPAYVINVSQEILKLPEVEFIAKACKMVVGYLFP